jgi:hypothetical protein
MCYVCYVTVQTRVAGSSYTTSQMLGLRGCQSLAGRGFSSVFLNAVSLCSAAAAAAAGYGDSYAKCGDPHCLASVQDETWKVQCNTALSNEKNYRDFHVEARSLWRDVNTEACMACCRARTIRTVREIRSSKPVICLSGALVSLKRVTIIYKMSHWLMDWIEQGDQVLLLTWSTRTPWGTRRHLSGNVKTSYGTAWTLLEPCLNQLWSSHSRRFVQNWGAGMPETSSTISLIGQNHVSNWSNT